MLTSGHGMVHITHNAYSYLPAQNQPHQDTYTNKRRALDTQPLLMEGVNLLWGS